MHHEAVLTFADVLAALDECEEVGVDVDSLLLTDNKLVFSHLERLLDLLLKPTLSDCVDDYEEDVMTNEVLTVEEVGFADSALWPFGVSAIRKVVSDDFILETLQVDFVGAELLQTRNSDLLHLVEAEELLAARQALLHEVHGAIAVVGHVKLSFNCEDSVEVLLRPQHEAEVSGAHGYQVWVEVVGCRVDDMDVAVVWLRRLLEFLHHDDGLGLFTRVDVLYEVWLLLLARSAWLVSERVELVNNLL